MFRLQECSGAMGTVRASPKRSEGPGKQGDVLLASPLQLLGK